MASDVVFYPRTIAEVTHEHAIRRMVEEELERTKRTNTVERNANRRE